jgi:hypothetical protein
MRNFKDKKTWVIEDPKDPVVEEMTKQEYYDTYYPEDMQKHRTRKALLITIYADDGIDRTAPKSLDEAIHFLKDEVKWAYDCLDNEEAGEHPAELNVKIEFFWVVEYRLSINSNSWSLAVGYDGEEFVSEEAAEDELYRIIELSKQEVSDNAPSWFDTQEEAEETAAIWREAYS